MGLVRLLGDMGPCPVVIQVTGESGVEPCLLPAPGPEVFMSLFLIRAGGGMWPEVFLSGANGTGRPWPSGQNPPRQAVPERAVPQRRLSPLSTACLSETLSSSVSPTHQVLGLIPPCRTPNPLSSLYCRRAEARPGLGCPWALGSMRVPWRQGVALEGAQTITWQMPRGVQGAGGTLVTAQLPRICALKQHGWFILTSRRVRTSLSRCAAYTVVASAGPHLCPGLRRGQRKQRGTVVLY